MSDAIKSATFQGSRIKAIPAPIMVMALAFLYLIVVYHIYTPFARGRVLSAVLVTRPILLLPLVVIGGMEFFLVALIFVPKVLTLTLTGWAEKMLFWSEDRKWIDFNEAKIFYLPNPKAGDYVIKLPSLTGREDVFIRGGGYKNEQDEILRAIKLAREGTLNQILCGRFIDAIRCWMDTAFSRVPRLDGLMVLPCRFDLIAYLKLSPAIKGVRTAPAYWRSVVARHTLPYRCFLRQRSIGSGLASHVLPLGVARRHHRGAVGA